MLASSSSCQYEQEGRSFRPNCQAFLYIRSRREFTRRLAIPHPRDRCRCADRLTLSQEEADRIFDAVVREVNKHRVPLAKLAVEDTSIGCFEDKVVKNGIAWQVELEIFLVGCKIRVTVLTV
jgi:hypothetical protein